MSAAPRSRKVNIAVMTASVGEHQRQMNFHLTRPLITFFQKLYGESADKARETHRAGSEDDLKLFQGQLKLVPKWNQNTIEEVVDLILTWLRNKHFKLMQSVKTVIVGRTMLMVAMGNANSEVDERVRVDIPNKYHFMHNVLSQVAYELFVSPSLVRTNSRDTDMDLRSKTADLRSIIEHAIENTVVDQLSSPAVFRYLDNAMNADSFDGDGVTGVEDEEEEQEHGDEGDDGDEGDEGDEDEEPALLEAEAALEADEVKLDDLGFEPDSGVGEVSEVAVPAAAELIDETDARVSKPVGAKSNEADDTFDD